MRIKFWVKSALEDSPQLVPACASIEVLQVHIDAAKDLIVVFQDTPLTKLKSKKLVRSDNLTVIRHDVCQIFYTNFVSII